MYTTLLIYTNLYDVKIVQAICDSVEHVTLIVSVCFCIVYLAKAYCANKKSKPDVKQEKDAGKTDKTNAEKENRDYEMLKLDKAKALVKDFYEATKDKDQKKDFQTAEKLVSLYNSVLEKEKLNGNEQK